MPNPYRFRLSENRHTISVLAETIQQVRRVVGLKYNAAFNTGHDVRGLQRRTSATSLSAKGFFAKLRFLISGPHVDSHPCLSAVWRSKSSSFANPFATMASRDDRGYQVVYRSKPREADDLEPLSRQSTRTSNYSYDLPRDVVRYEPREPREPRDLRYSGSAARPSATRRRSSDDFHRRDPYRERDRYQERARYQERDRYQDRDRGTVVIEPSRSRPEPSRYPAERRARSRDNRDYEDERPRNYDYCDRDRYGRNLYDRSPQQDFVALTKMRTESPPRIIVSPEVPRESRRTRDSVYPRQIDRDNYSESDRHSSDRGRRNIVDPEAKPEPRIRSALRGGRAAEAERAVEVRQRAPSPAPSYVRASRPKIGRSRSVSLKLTETDIRDHEAEAEREWHERPGREARHAGKYLGHPLDDDLISETYVERAKSGARGEDRSRHRRRSRSGRD